MKAKLMGLFLVLSLLLLAVSVSATPWSVFDRADKLGDSNIEKWMHECTDNGYDFAIAKFERVGDSCGQFRMTQQNKGVLGYRLAVSGTDAETFWKASSRVSGVFVQSGQSMYAMDGGFSGIIKPTEKQLVRQITFCGNYDGGSGCADCGGPGGVPEFSTMTLALAVIGGALGISVMRKK